MVTSVDFFDEIWLLDFEFHAPQGEQPLPLCLVAREIHSGRLVRQWLELDSPSAAPFAVGERSLFVAYFASAELGCFLSLGWPVPVRILDLYVEFRCLTNGLSVPCGNGLLGALAYYGINSLGTAEKTQMRELAIRGGPYNAAERLALLDYCQTDVDALAKLLPAMLPAIDMPRALLRGRYMAAVAQMEHNGVPIDLETLNALRGNWERIKHRLTADVDQDYGVYVPTQRRTTKTDQDIVQQSADFHQLSFNMARFAGWLTEQDIPWPHLDSGNLDLSDDAFRQMARQHPVVAPLRELRHTLSQLRLNDLAVGNDRRNRCLLSPFRARTSRNQPSNSKFIFGPSCWLRSLIQPAAGRAVAYIDWEQQEFGIAAALSGDGRMQEAYLSGDPYLAFAKQAGAVPADATKLTHPQQRGQFKVCSLAVQYGMGPCSLSESLGEPEVRGRELLRLHRQTYPAFWKWSEAAVSHAMLRGWLQTVFGWQIRVGPNANPRSLANFPMQANGAEMLRLACCLATERGIQVCAPVHDALLVESAIEEIDATISETQQAMRDASEIVLDGFQLRTDAEIVRHPGRYQDKRGERLWDTVMRLLGELPSAGVFADESFRIDQLQSPSQRIVVSPTSQSS
jgi:hypothetical protein